MRSTLYPTVTGLGDPLTGARGRALREIPAASGAADSLQTLADEPSGLDVGEVAVGSDRYERLADRAAPSPRSPSVDQLFQGRPTKALRGRHAEPRGRRWKLRRGSTSSLDDAPNRDGDRACLCALLRRATRGARVPLLLEALDPSGIGFESAPPGTESLSARGGAWSFGPSPDARVPWNGQERLLFQKLAEALRDGGLRRYLSRNATSRSSPRLPSKRPPRGPRRLGGHRVALGRGYIEGNYRLHLSAICESTVGAWPPLGRFLQDDPRLHGGDLRRAPGGGGARSDGLHAEIAYLPQALTSNTCSRPLLRPYEIDLLGSSGAPPDRRIPFALRLAGIDPRRSRVRLRSRMPHGKRVVPHRSCAHSDGFGGLCLFTASSSSFRHRTSTARSAGRGPPRRLSVPPCASRTAGSVLSLAQWNLTGERVRELAALRGAERFEAVQELRRVLRLPRFVRFLSDDNTLIVDLENVLSIESWLSACKRADPVPPRRGLPRSRRARRVRAPGGVPSRAIGPAPSVPPLCPPGRPPALRREAARADSTPREATGKRVAVRKGVLRGGRHGPRSCGTSSGRLHAISGARAASIAGSSSVMETRGGTSGSVCGSSPRGSGPRLRLSSTSGSRRPARAASPGARSRDTLLSRRWSGIGGEGRGSRSRRSSSRRTATLSSLSPGVSGTIRTRAGGWRSPA